MLDWIGFIWRILLFVYSRPGLSKIRLNVVRLLSDSPFARSGLSVIISCYHYIMQSVCQCWIKLNIFVIPGIITFFALPRFGGFIQPFKKFKILNILCKLIQFIQLNQQVTKFKILNPNPPKSPKPTAHARFPGSIF